jgi:dolichyl-diphosphooligosaccharide--protein glycosyltransferase
LSPTGSPSWPTREEHSDRWRRLAVHTALFGLALAARGKSYPEVLGTGRLIAPQGGDEYYHLRRIAYSVSRFPELLERDPYVSFPQGAEIVWPPGFDWPLAALVRPLASGDPATLESILAWLPALLGALTVVAAAALAWRCFSPAAGVVAGILLALLPSHHFYTQLGTVDHHAAAALAGILMLAGAMRMAEQAPGTRATAVGMGLGAAASLSIWPGALLHVALLQGLGLVWMLGASGREAAALRAGRLALALGVTALALAPLCLGKTWSGYGSWSPLVLSNFQVAWFGGTAAGAALLALAWRRPRLGATGPRRCVTAAALGGVGLVIVWTVGPELTQALDYAMGWFRKDEAFQQHVLELQPLLSTLGRFTLVENEPTLSRLLYAFPLAVAHLAWRARGERTDLRALLVWTCAFSAAVLAQRRFANTFVVVYAVVLGGACTSLVALAWSRAGGRPGLRAGVAVAALAAAAFSLAPLAPVYAHRARQWHAYLRQEPLVRAPAEHRKLSYMAASRWLKKNSPPTSGYLDPDLQPEYGVLAAWGLGHLVRYVAERPMVQDNFGVYGGREGFEAAERYYAATNEPDAVEIARGLSARYVYADGTGSGHSQGYTSTSLAARLLTFGEGVGGNVSGPLVHHRLRWETRTGYPLRIFEIVEGANVEGLAAPNTRVVARLVLRGKSTFGYQWATSAQSDGRYSLRLPYATGERGVIATGNQYSIASGGREASLAVPEEAVLTGRTLAGPDLRSIRREPEGDRE